ncbi:DNA-3-methyladenine glycosylase 2 family protein [Methylophilaceae bacterium]|nr:DNA-3-methyladenine glycosylase 2 family protein [Methylophilaceae bacterium]
MQVNPLIGDRNSKYKEASDFLSKIDADWETLIKKIGGFSPKIGHDLEPYQSLIKSVIFQQLHPKAGNAIFERFLMIFNNEFPDDKSILEKSSIEIKSCGLSQNKLLTILEIAYQNTINKLPTSIKIISMADDEIIKLFTKIKGIGEWTAQMLLIFNLGRLDIMPHNDLAIRRNYQKLKRLANPITPKEIIEISAAWSPYRSVASWYLWRFDQKPPNLSQ